MPHGLYVDPATVAYVNQTALDMPNYIAPVKHPLDLPFNCDKNVLCYVESIGMLFAFDGEKWRCGGTEQAIGIRNITVTKSQVVLTIPEKQNDKLPDSMLWAAGLRPQIGTVVTKFDDALVFTQDRRIYKFTRYPSGE